MKVFISYAQSDLAVARGIATTLAKGNHQVWVDYDQIYPGDNWAQKIADGLSQSDAIVSIISPDSMKSRSVRGDIEYALGTLKFEGRLIPVMVKPTKDFPWILEKIHLIDATRKPTAAGAKVLTALQRSTVGSR